MGPSCQEFPDHVSTPRTGKGKVDSALHLDSPSVGPRSRKLGLPERILLKGFLLYGWPVTSLQPRGTQSVGDRQSQIVRVSNDASAEIDKWCTNSNKAGEGDTGRWRMLFLFQIEGQAAHRDLREGRRQEARC